MKNAVILFAGLLLTSVTQAQTYDIDPGHSQVDFTVRHMMISDVRGEFGKVSGVVVIDPKDQKLSKIEATIDANTINTREPKRDEHLRNADFFDVKKFPAITFKSTEVKKMGPKKLGVKGDLTIHGVTKPVKFVADVTPEVKDPWGNARRGATAKLKINRKDYGLGWNKVLEAGGMLVGEDVNILMNIEAIRRPEPAAAATPAPAKESATAATTKTQAKNATSAAPAKTHGKAAAVTPGTAASATKPAK